MTDGDYAVHPGTGEILEHLDQQPAEALAETLDAVRGRQDELDRWAGALDRELRRRLKLRSAKLAVFGDWEVQAPTGNQSVWDADELEPVLAGLVADGTVRAADIADVITRPPVVSVSRANRLLARLTGDAHSAVAACRTWKEKPGKLLVARSVQLMPDAEQVPPSLRRTATHQEHGPSIEGTAAGPAEHPSDAPETRERPSVTESGLDHRELFA